jgi:hypothetical protein
MIGLLQCVVLDCPDGLRLARFYQALLGGEVNQTERTPSNSTWTSTSPISMRPIRRSSSSAPLRVDPRGWRIYADPAGHPFCLLQAAAAV